MCRGWCKLQLPWRPVLRPRVSRPGEPMRLDVLIPTHNRAAMLPRALESLLAARRPATLDVGVTVVDNLSVDNTRAVVESFMPRFGGQLQYLYEEKPGRSHALNTGI